jgi:hypothetical protein
VEGLSVETLAKNWNSSFRKFNPTVAFEITVNNVWLHFTLNKREDCKMYMGLMEYVEVVINQNNI